MTPLALNLVVAASLVIAGVRAGQQPAPAGRAVIEQAPAKQVAEKQTPYFDARSHQTRYAGPTGSELSIDKVTEVRIGYFGPPDIEDPLNGSMWKAAQRAVAEANRQGGLRGKPFRLVPAWSANPWGTGVKQLTQLVYRDRVWAIVGGVDGPTTHLAEQVVAKARLALVSPSSTDKSVNLANVPWMFSIAPGDHLIAAVLGPAIARAASGKCLVLLSANDHDSRLLTRELRAALGKHRVVPQFQFEWDPNGDQRETLVEQCIAKGPDVVIVAANAIDSVSLVRTLRQKGFAKSIFGGPAFGRSYFLTHVGGDVGTVFFPIMIGRRESCQDDLSASQGATSGEVKRAAARSAKASDDDFAALQTYDAVRLVVRAIRVSGLNRAAIGAAIRDLAPWHGVSGAVVWDGLGSNTRRPRLGTLVKRRAAESGANQTATMWRVVDDPRHAPHR